MIEIEYLEFLNFYFFLNLKFKAAERFVKFVNSLSDDKTTDLTKDMIKSLFKIEIENETSSNDKRDNKRLSVDIGDDPRKLSKVNLEKKKIINISGTLFSYLYFLFTVNCRKSRIY